MATPWVDYWMVQNVNYYWTWVGVNPLCQNHFTCDANLFIPYQSSHQPCKEYKLEMVSVLVCWL